MDKKEELKYAQMAMTWYGWGSPVGLGLFILCLAGAIVLGTMALNHLTDAGKKGIEIERMEKRMNPEMPTNSMP